MNSTTFNSTPPLELVLKHLGTVRELDEYVHDGALDKDIDALRDQLRKALNRDLPEHWEPLEEWKGCLYSRPRDKWNVPKGDYLALEVYLALPVADDDESYIGLYVPAGWKKREQFLKKLKAPQGFDHVNHDPDGDWTEDSSIWKYVKYQDHLSSDGILDWSGFLKAIRDAVASIVTMEHDIDGILKQLA